MSAAVTCRDFVAFLAAYLAGELAAAERAEFDFHLAHCPSCVIYMNTYHTTWKLVRAAAETPDAPVPREVPEELVEAILAARRARGTDPA